MIRDVGETLGSKAMEAVGRAMARTQEHSGLGVDLLTSEDAYLAVFDAPGAQGEDVQARYEDGAVLVRIDRFREHREGFEMRFPGRGLSLDGRVELPDDADVDPDGATATLADNGTLQVRGPRADDPAAADA